MIPTGSCTLIPGLYLVSLFGDAGSGLPRAALSPDLYLVPFLIHQDVRNPYIIPSLWTNVTVLSPIWWTKIRSQNQFFLSYIISVTYVVTGKQLTYRSTKKELPMLTFSKCEHSIQLPFLPSCPSHFPHCFIFLFPWVFFLFPWHLPLNNTGTDHQIRCKAQNEQWFLWLYQKTYKLVERELTTPLNIQLRVFVSFIIIWMPQTIIAMSKGWHMVCLCSYKSEYVQSQEFIFKTSPTLQTVMK